MLPRQLQAISFLFLNCILYFLSRYFQLDSRNLEITVNSFEATNFRQILTLLRVIHYGNVRFISSRDLTKYFANCHPRFPLRGGERKHFSAVKSEIMLSKYGRTSFTKNRPKISFVLLVFSLSAVGIPFARY